MTISPRLSSSITTQWYFYTVKNTDIRQKTVFSRQMKLLLSAPACFIDGAFLSSPSLTALKLLACRLSRLFDLRCSAIADHLMQSWWLITLWSKQRELPSHRPCESNHRLSFPYVSHPTNPLALFNNTSRKLVLLQPLRYHSRSDNLPHAITNLWTSPAANLPPRTLI